MDYRRISHEQLKKDQTTWGPTYAEAVVTEAAKHIRPLGAGYSIVTPALLARVQASMPKLGPLPVKSGDGGWGALHRWASTGAPARIGQAVRTYAGQIGVERGRQLLELINAYPSPVNPSHADACRYTLELHNAINGRANIRKKHIGYEEAAKLYGWPPAWPCDELHCHTTASGIGDAVVGVYVACGLADATGRRVVYHVDYPDWMVGIFEHPNVMLVPARDGRSGPDMWGGWYGYGWETAWASTRAEAWCDNVAAGYGLPKFKPSKPKYIDRRTAGDVPAGPYVLLAPMANYESRNWSPMKWRELIKLLHADGIRCEVIGKTSHAEPLKQIVLPSPSTTVLRYGLPARNVRDLILGASCVVGNDSGIAHYAGLLRTPTISVHPGSLPHDFLFACADSVRSVTSPHKLARNGANTGHLNGIASGTVKVAVMGHRDRSPIAGKPRVAVLSLADDRMADLRDFTFPNKRVYADRHGYGCHLLNESQDPTRHPSWSKIRMLQKYLPDHDWCLWHDADAIFTNMGLSLDTLLDTSADMVIARDANGINAGVFAVRNTPAASDFLRRVWAQVQYGHSGWWEQSAMMHLLDAGTAGVDVRYVAKRSINSYPGEDWQPGDLVMHAPGRSGRLELLHGATMVG